MGSFIPTQAYAVGVDLISDVDFFGEAGLWILGALGAENVFVPEHRLVAEEDTLYRQEEIQATVATVVFRAHYLLTRVQEVFQRPEDEVRTPEQNRILGAQRLHLQAEWESTIRDLNFYLDQGWLPWEGIRAFFQENIEVMPLAFYGARTSQGDLQIVRWTYRLGRLINELILRDSRRILESTAVAALEQANGGLRPAVAVAEEYRWARYCYGRRAELDGRRTPLERFAEQIAYWEAQAGEDVMWGGSNNEHDPFFALDALPAVTLDRVIEIRDIYTHYGEQTQIIVDDGELTQPHAHWGDLFDAALVRVRELIERGDTQRAELYMLFALYLKTGERGWFLLLNEHSDADAPSAEAIVLPEINDETALLFTELLAIYLSNPENELKGSIYSSIILLYLANASESELMSFLGQVGRRLHPNHSGNASMRVGYARLIGECLGRGVLGLVSISVRDSAYELLVLFIKNHLSVRGPFEGQASLASMAPLVRFMIQPSSELSPDQLGRLLGWMQRMLGVTGFKKLLRETYKYSEEQIAAFVREALITVGDIAQAMPASELPHNEVINSMFILWGHFTEAYEEQAHDAMRRVVEHWNFEQMEEAFNAHCKKKMLKRNWASEYELLKGRDVIS